MPFDPGSYGMALNEPPASRERQSAGFRWLFDMHDAQYERLLRELPRPEYILHLTPSRHESGARLAYTRWKPSVHLLLEPLYGRRGRAMPKDRRFCAATDGEKKRGVRDILRYELEEPSKKEKKNLFLRALGLVHEFSSWEDLMPLCAARRQITNTGGCLEIDLPLFLLMQKASPFLRPVEIINLAERMPPRSHVRGLLLWLATRRVKTCLVSLGSV